MIAQPAASSIVDFAIVGAGIAGASLAFHLGPRGSVVLLEMEAQPGRHATGRSAALFSETHGSGAIRTLTAASRAFFDNPPPGFAEHRLLTPRGVLHIATAEQAARLQQTAAAIRALDPSVELHDATFAQKLVPILRDEAVAGGCLWEPDATDIDVHALLTGYLRGARAAGARLETDNRIERIERTGDTWQLTGTNGTTHARVVINAAGAWADEVAVMAGAAPLGMTPLQRTATIVDGPADTDIEHWPFTIHIDETMYFKPDVGKLLLSPCDETPSPPGDASPEELDVAIAVDRLQTTTTLDVRHVRHRWAGLRTFAPDRTPVVGFDDRVPGFFWLAGQGGYGVQTAPAMSALAAALLLGVSDPGGATLGALVPVLAPGRFRA
jgi:D-arginine dehydrogenase